ncbi:hypothetical protein IEQ34_015294 [Dendrobium chrysotoxum]|uniref:26S proteasome complex subunit SEM1 n=1 Tax=Dendrobium chrysotoxum TaxID=161865 RepID=A0AAV7GGB0_DENCH|nr:hypothetical protein IEQ34_015294 [Dendrobium chrysotoxum]
MKEKTSLEPLNILTKQHTIKFSSLLFNTCTINEWDDKEEGKDALQQWEDDWDDDDVNDDFSRQLRKELESNSEKK